MTTKRFESNVVRTRTKADVPVPFDPNARTGLETLAGEAARDTTSWAKAAAVLTSLDADACGGTKIISRPVTSHSARNATLGSTRAARSAGARLATTATTSRTPTTPA